MSFNTTSAAPAADRQIEKKIELAIDCLWQDRSAQAFLILSEPGFEKEPAARFALGLCHLRAKDASSALVCFEQALTLLKSVSSLKRGIENNRVYLTLAAEQIKESVYLSPMDPAFCASFSEAAEQTVLLAMIYVYLQQGMTEQAKRLSSGLIGPEFEEYKRKLADCI